MDMIRCPWCLGDNDYLRYHDEEWGVPLRENRRLFALLLLEGAQAGLSWLTVLKRRSGYLAAMDGLEAEKLARYTESDRSRLAADTRIIRNRRKILSAVENARAYLRMRERGIDFSVWLWDHVDGRPIVNQWKTMAEVPAVTPLAERISKELRAEGFSFVGPTIIYAYLQSAGLVNDHLADCFRHGEVQRPYF